uniref:RHO protein GDP dissociation inhibitor n=1 Tax=Heterorhabditis bacteriophora TaxID=37862 RepID=A0A1I7WX44_HETBA
MQPTTMVFHHASRRIKIVMTDNISDDFPVDSLYKPPEKKSVDEILSADQEDESLTKYKATLLGSAPKNAVVDEMDERIVILKSISLVVNGRPDVKMELSNAGALEDATFKLKEGCQYRLRFDFFVQREIVTGLKYIHKVSRYGVPVLKEAFMVGSYAPKAEIQSYITPIEEVPSGMVHRGKYKVKSKLTDDDEHNWLTWTWTTEIAKDW